MVHFLFNELERIASSLHLYSEVSVANPGENRSY